MVNKYCVLILSHGRPDRIYTYRTLRRHGYTGPIFIVIDDYDKTAEEYKRLYKKEVVVFNKQRYIDETDKADNFGKTKTIVFARNAGFDIAESLGYKQFIELDDDYTSFVYKYNKTKCYEARPIRNLDAIWDLIFNFYASHDILSTAMSQTGDHIGGKYSGFGLKGSRKAMNSFFLSTERRFKFIGTINEDVNTYFLLGGQGKIFLTIPIVALQQKSTQQNQGGMTDVYLDHGTYLKTFYTVMLCPSSVKCSIMVTKNKRIHHRINWKATVPKIISDRFKKIAAQEK